MTEHLSFNESLAIKIVDFLFNGILGELADIKAKVHQLIRQGGIMSQQLEDLKAAVAQEGTVVQSAITLLNGLSAQLAAIKDDPAAIEQLAADVQAQAAALGSAVAANTVAEPPSTEPAP